MKGMKKLLSLANIRRAVTLITVVFVAVFLVDPLSSSAAENVREDAETVDTEMVPLVTVVPVPEEAPELEIHWVSDTEVTVSVLVFDDQAISAVAMFDGAVQELSLGDSSTVLDTAPVVVGEQNIAAAVADRLSDLNVQVNYDDGTVFLFAVPNMKLFVVSQVH